MTRPPFIVLEGIEGSGKSTQCRLLAKWLDELGIPHLVTREPGGTPLGERIRETVLHGTELKIPPESELLLILAARAAFVRDVVRPALERGVCVVSDRFSWSTYAYQGHGRGLPQDSVRALDRFATGGLEPDLYVLLDVGIDEGQARQRSQGKVADRFEGEDGSFLERVHAGYRSLLADAGAAVRVDGTGPPKRVQEAVRAALQARFPGTFNPASV